MTSGWIQHAQSGDHGLPIRTSQLEGPRARVLLVCPRVVATFVRQDLEILRSQFEASLFPFEGFASLARLRREINASDVVVIWFAGRHAGPAVWFSRRVRVPVITIVGGFEAAWLPEIGYGIRPNSIRSRVLRWILRHSSRVLAVSQTTEAGIVRIAHEALGKMAQIYNAVDTTRFLPPESRGRDGVLCVGSISRMTLSLKGWRLFRETARRMPTIPFIAIGRAVDGQARDFVSELPPNLQWLGEKTGDDLLAQFQAASLYFQGSMHESFSLALAEAMACGCVPVVSRNGALPEVAGDVGYYLDDLTVESAVKAVSQALNAPEERRIAARQRMVEHFDYERRRLALCGLVQESIERSQRERG
jgi:glycosyltransferase involved in cell wall biosynthesis